MESIGLTWIKERGKLQQKLYCLFDNPFYLQRLRFLHFYKLKCHCIRVSIHFQLILPVVVFFVSFRMFLFFLLNQLNELSARIILLRVKCVLEEIVDSKGRKNIDLFLDHGHFLSFTVELKVQMLEDVIFAIAFDNFDFRQFFGMA